MSYCPRSAVTAILLTLGLSISAFASTINFQMMGGDPAYAVFGRSVIDPATNTRVNSDAMQGGRFSLRELTGGTFNGDLLGPYPQFWAFCIEPRQGISPGNYIGYSVVDLQFGTTNIGGMGVAKADRLRELFGRFYPDLSAPLTALQAGAMQIAIWEIVREDSGTLDVFSGDIYFYTNGSTTPTGVVSLAQTYVQAINGGGPRAGNLFALTSPTNQDLIVQGAVPEPATFALIGCALIGLSLLRRVERRRRQPC